MPPTHCPRPCGSPSGDSGPERLGLLPHGLQRAGPAQGRPQGGSQATRLSGHCQDVGGTGRSGGGGSCRDTSRGLVYDLGHLQGHWSIAKSCWPDVHECQLGGRAGLLGPLWEGRCPRHRGGADVHWASAEGRVESWLCHLESLPGPGRGRMGQGVSSLRPMCSVSVLATLRGKRRGPSPQGCPAGGPLG